ncbi:MAG TPA: PDZ domain-containing protein, partial [Gemmataceae bacterium]|nr:PDZ domain-containing protein [Gemmataceae bacterium]
SGGGRMACTIAYSLPGLFGGVAPVCGTNPLPQLAYLRHRVADRLSVAFVTGEKDFNRSENELLMAPLFRDLGVRSRLWLVKGMGHAMPGPDVLHEVYAWLEDDLQRRKQESARPGMALAPDEAPTAKRQAGRLLEAAKEGLKAPEHTWRAAALLQGVVARWGDSDAGDEARKLLKELQDDPKRVRLIAEQGGAEERRTLTAQAKAFERLGDKRRALQAWRLLAQHHPDAPEGKKAAEQARRLADALAATPYLGVVFAGDTARVTQVVPKGPADRAGFKPGDVLVRWREKKVSSLDDVRRALAKHRPGDKVEAEVNRGGKSVTLTVELGATPTEEKP